MNLRIMDVLILGDSLSFGRPKHLIFYRDTWPYKLSEHGFRVLNRARGGSGIKAVISELKSINNYYMPSSAQKVDERFELCLVQVGIVDVTPRLVDSRLHKLLSWIPIYKRLFVWLSRKSWLYDLIGKSWVGEGEIEGLLIQLDSELQRAAVEFFFISVSPPFHRLKENCGDFSELVNDYNKKIDNIFPGRRIDIEFSSDLLLPDGHHLTAEGHQRVAQEILNFIEKRKV